MADIELVIKIPKDVYTRLFDNGIQDNEIATDDICEMARSLRRGTPLDEVLDKIRDEIEAEMNDLYRQKSIDQRTLTIIHACQRHIAIIDEYTKGEGE